MNNEVYELKVIFGFVDMEGNRYPRLRPEITWQDVEHLSRSMSQPQFADFCERNKHPGYNE